MIICIDCGGYEELDTCVCHEPAIDIMDLSCLKTEPKQICHFCGVDLFLPRTDLNIRMCVPCGLALNHEECCRCIICNKTWLIDECVDVASGSVCVSCKSL